MNIDVFSSFDADIKRPVLAAQKIDVISDADVFQYQLMSCTWITILRDLDIDTSHFLHYIQGAGMFKAIDVAQETAKIVLLQQDPYLFVTIPEMLSLVVGYFHNKDYAEIENRFKLVDALRYPKRFCSKNDDLVAACEQSFFYDHENEMKKLTEDYWNTSDNPNLLRNIVICEMKEILCDLLPEPVKLPYDEQSLPELTDRQISWYNRCVDQYNEMWSWFDYEDPACLPTGVCADAKTKLGKLNILAHRHPFEFQGFPFDVITPTERIINADSAKAIRKTTLGSGITVHTFTTKVSGYVWKSSEPTPKWQTGKSAKSYTLYSIENDNIQYADVVAVPKTYDEYRIVCKEQCYRLAKSKNLAQWITSQLYEQTFGAVDLDDQNRNGELARVASIDGRLATVDWSHASDGYCTAIAEAVLPAWLVKAIRSRRANFVYLHGRLSVNWIYLTMGHTLTPAIQSALFYALCRAVQNIGRRYGLNFDETIGVYNDDTIIDSQLVPLLFECGRAIGLTPNEKKSFYSYDFLYRESCGVEAFNGHILKGHYWPRTRIAVRNKMDIVDNYDTLISLQHTIACYTKASSGLISVLEGMYPNITFSDYGTDDVSDIAWRFRSKTEAVAPYDHDRMTVDNPPEYMIRHKHLRCVGTWPRPKDVDPNTQKLAEYYTYLDYLRFGPMYASPLDELLRTSEKRNPNALYVDQVNQLSLIRE